MSGNSPVVDEKLQLRQKVKNLEMQFIGLLKSLCQTIDARDSYARGHSIRVCQYALAIGAELNLSPKRLKQLEIAALLHDIGKVGVETFILRKSVALDDLEIMTIRYHTLLAVRMLEPVKQLADVIPFIRHHHEHYDGSGYPDGIRGDQIPLEARILTVADSFEAMTSNRPYRKAMTPQAALGELQEKAGTQFDRRVVQVFCTAFEKGEITVSIQGVA